MNTPQNWPTPILNVVKTLDASSYAPKYLTPIPWSFPNPIRTLNASSHRTKLTFHCPKRYKTWMRVTMQQNRHLTVLNDVRTLITNSRGLKSTTTQHFYTLTSLKTLSATYYAPKSRFYCPKHWKNPENHLKNKVPVLKAARDLAKACFESTVDSRSLPHHTRLIIPTLYSRYPIHRVNQVNSCLASFPSSYKSSSA